MRFRFFSRRNKKLLVLAIMFIAGSAATTKTHVSPLAQIKASLNKGLYEQLGLGDLGLSKEVFEKAVKGWQNLSGLLKPEKQGLLSIADLSQSSRNKRLYVIDLENKQVIFNTYVAHGRNSGEEFASAFGNKPESYRTSLGFYVTGEPYVGAHGISLRLQGSEKGINDRAEERGIVIHGADYVSEEFINATGRLGRSQGCPAVPTELCGPIVDKIKNGSCFFIFYPDSAYFRKSVFFRQ